MIDIHCQNCEECKTKQKAAHPLPTIWIASVSRQKFNRLPVRPRVLDAFVWPKLGSFSGAGF